MQVMELVTPYIPKIPVNDSRQDVKEFSKRQPGIMGIPEQIKYKLLINRLAGVTAGLESAFSEETIRSRKEKPCRNKRFPKL